MATARPSPPPSPQPSPAAEVRPTGPSSDAGTLLALVMAVVAALASMLLGGTRAAGAHGDEGTMAVTVAEQSGPSTVHVEVGITYANDDDLAQEATVTATLTAPDGTEVGPVPLTLVDETSSKYGADVAVPGPGTWTLAVTSTGPEATATGSVTVTRDAPATSRPTTTTTRGPGTTSGPTVPVDPEEATSDEGGVVLPLVIAAGAAAAVGGYVVARRRSS